MLLPFLCLIVLAGAGSSVAWPRAAAAHAAAPLTPDRVWHAWNLDPIILAGLILTGLLYARGVTQLWRRAGAGGGIPRWRVGAFAAGWAALAVALVSPLDRLGATLFSAHMVQHLLLIVVAAPLLVLGAPLAPFVWSLPTSWRRDRRWRPAFGAVTGTFAIPLLAWSLHLVALWLWHLPALYDGALGSGFVHALEHASFFGTALVFWWVVSQAGPRRRLGYGTAALAVFVMGAQGAVLGALIALARGPWYSGHGGGPSAWGLTPLEDQQLAGFIMWMPAGVVYLVAGLLLFAAWMHTSDQRRRTSPLEPSAA